MHGNLLKSYQDDYTNPYYHIAARNPENPDIIENIQKILGLAQTIQCNNQKMDWKQATVLARARLKKQGLYDRRQREMDMWREQDGLKRY